MVSDDRHPTAFVSYTWDSSEHRQRVKGLVDDLRAYGIDAISDHYHPNPPEGFVLWMTKHIRDADYVLMICTERYYARVMRDESPQPGIGLGGKWEGGLIMNQFYKEGMLSHKFLPLLLESSDGSFVPDPFAAVARYDLEQPDGFERLYRRLTGQLAEPPPLGAIVRLPSDDGGSATGSYHLRVDPTPQPGGDTLSQAMAQMREQLLAEVGMRLSSIEKSLGPAPSRAEPSNPSEFLHLTNIVADFFVYETTARLRGLIVSFTSIGADLWEVSNKGQDNAPVTLTIRFRASLGEESTPWHDVRDAQLHFDLLPGRDRTVRDIIGLFDVRDALRQEREFFLQDAQTGVILFQGRTRPGAVVSPEPIPLLHDLRAVQKAFPDADIPFPSELLEAYVRQLAELAVIARTGHYERQVDRVYMSGKPAVVRGLLSHLPADGILAGLSMEQFGVEVTIMGAVLMLGEVRTAVCPVRIENITALRAWLEMATDDDVFELSLIPASEQNHTIIEDYRHFPRRP